MKIIELEQNTPEWLEWRNSGFSASEAPSVMGESKYFPKTPFQLYQVKTGQKEVVYTKAMADGHKYEEKALELANKAFNTNYQPTCASNGDFIASLDGYDANAKIPVLEIKTTTEGSDLWQNGLIIYKWQLVHQCIVAECDKAILWVYAKDTDTVKPEVFELKKEDVEALKKAWLEFGKAMDSFTAPALTKADYVENESEQWLELAKKYQELKEKRAEADERIKQIKDALVQIAADQPTKGGGISVYPVTRAGNVNYKKIPELKDVDLEQYRGKPVTYWGVR